MSSNQSIPKARDTLTNEGSFQKLCNDSSLFNDFGHFEMRDASYAEETTHVQFRLKTPALSSWRMPEDVFDIYEYSVNL